MLGSLQPHRPLLLAIAGQFIFGVLLALPGTLFGIRGWTGPLGFDIEAQARLLVVFFTGQLACTALAGLLVDRVGCERVLAAGAGLLMAGFAALGQADGPPGGYAAAVLLATGGASTNAASNTLVSVSYGGRRGPMLSVMALFGAVGSLTTPLVFLGVADLPGVVVRLRVLSVLALVLAVLPLPGPVTRPVSTRHSPVATLGLLRDPWLAGLVLLLALDFGVEAVLAGWTGAYAISILPGVSSGFVIALYWSGLCAGRLLAPWVLVRSPKLVVVLGGSLLVAASVGGMAMTTTLPLLVVAVTAAGFGIGPLAPTIVAVAGDRYPQRTGAVLGLLLSLAQVGGMLLPWVLARVATASSLRVALLVPLAGALGIAAGAALTWRQRAAKAAVIRRADLL